MKKYLILLMVLAWTVSAWGDNVTTSDPIELVVRSLFLDGNYGTPDSMRITTWYNGSQVFDAWYNSADAASYTADGWLAFTSTLGAIDGAGGDGSYTVIASAYSFDSTLYTDRAYTYTVGVGDTIQTDMSNYDGATPLVAADNVGINWGDVSNPGATVNLAATTVGSVTGAGVTSMAANVVTASALATDAVDEIVDANWDEILTGATHNIASSAGRRLRQLETGQVLLTGTINTANDSTATLGLSGNYPDDFFLHNWLVVTVGTDSVQIRQINGYTGATDSVDMAAAESWVINPVNGDEWEIIGNTGVHVVDLHPPVVLQIIAAMYDKGIWIDDGSGNTNTEPGVDGTRANPVSTFAAARTLADALGYQKYYLVNNTSLTLAATHEDWEFTGIGRGNSINFGSQDTDRSDFYNLMITGTQGGTGVVLLDLCYLNTPDSLEALVTRSSLSDTISLRVSTATVFDQCYSNIAGDNTPGLDFNSAAGTIEVGIRHYSGGITLLNGASTHTISYESIGQLIIDASCTSMNVTGRGIMDLTNNGTTTNLTDNAVVNITAIAEYPEYAYKVVATGSPTTIAIPLSYINPTPGNLVNDVFNGKILMPITGNAAKQVRNIVDFTIADSTLTIRPGLTTACNSGDTILILPSRMAVEPNPLSNHEITVAATGQVSINLDGTVGDFETADFEDSVFNAIKFDTDYYDTLAQIVSDNAGAGSGLDTLSTVFVDRLTGRVADTNWLSLLEARDGVAGSFGDSARGWGATGAGGDGNRLCSVLVANADGALSSGTVRMTSGGDSYTALISGDGFAIFNLNDATWLGLAYVTANTQDTIPQTFVITANLRDTITMSAQSVTGASAPNMCNAYLWVFDIVGDTVENVKLTAEINGNGPWFATDDSAAIIIPKKISAISADSGYVFVPLWRSSEVIDAAGNNPTYNFTLEKSRYFKWKVEDRTVPDTALYNIK